MQPSVVADTAAHAKALTKHHDDLIRSCTDRTEETSPATVAEGRDYGTLPVEEGVRVRGLHTETSWGATDIALLSVGRDERTVTVVQWAQLGDFTDAPVAAFKQTTTRAVNKLYGPARHSGAGAVLPPRGPGGRPRPAHPVRAAPTTSQCSPAGADSARTGALAAALLVASGGCTVSPTQPRRWTWPGPPATTCSKTNVLSSAVGPVAGRVPFIRRTSGVKGKLPAVRRTGNRFSYGFR